MKSPKVASPSKAAQARAQRQLIASLRTVPHKVHTCCRVCGTPLGQPVINLPDFPLSEIYVSTKPAEKVAVLDYRFCLCERCGHGQLVNTIPAQVLYGSNYFTRTSGSGPAKTAVDDFLAFVTPQLPKRRLRHILEIGCNDLYTLTKLRDRAETLCGVDPIWVGREGEVTDKRIRVVGGFIEDVDPARLGGTPDVVLCSHTLEHIDDPVPVFRNLIATAAAQTLHFFQFPGLEPLVRDGHFEQLHHQHLNYFTLQSVVAALDRAGAELLDYRYNRNHWGALMISFRKRPAGRRHANRKFLRGYRAVTRAEVRQRFGVFQASMAAVNAQIRALRADRPIYGFGAALMLPLLAYHVPEIAQLECIIDDDPLKQGLYYINLPVRIVPAKTVPDLAHATVVVTAITSKHNARNLTRRLIELNVQDIILPTNLL